MISREFLVFSGRANPPLAREICQYLSIKEGGISISNFSDGEIYVQIHENVRGRDVFVVQPTCPPVNENLMELLIIVDALKRSSARRITAVVPYYGYARQDRKDKPRVPITAKLVADLFTAAGVDRVLAMDLHAGQLQGFFDMPVDNLFATPVLLDYIKKQDYGDLMIVSPDAGGVERARAFAKRLGATLGIIDKRREGQNVSHVMNIIGDVKGKDVVLLDDIIDTAGTIVNAAQALMENGARSVRAYCTHPVFSGPAISRLQDSPLQEVVVTDTIPLRPEALRCKKITVLTVAPLLGEAIRRIHLDDSVSSLFV
ncbi:MAG: ribose-phosphate pyrophosphokinase [Nitrospinota bacterium]|nr:MAG: ribose-phosphate pyrophosphokinase [Nitrospinota bacterium]